MTTLLLLLLFPSSSTLQHHKIGLLYSTNSHHTQQLLNVAEYAISRLPAHNISLSILTQGYTGSHMSSVSAICELAQSNISLVISDSESTKSRIEADVLDTLHIPMISTTATNPFLKSSRKFLVMLSPSDEYQSQAVFNLLAHYNWFAFSILASANDYGINGLVRLKHLATLETRFTIVETLYFKVESEFSIHKELEILKNSLSRVIVLNCDAQYARSIFSMAHELGLMEKGFVWIVTDYISTQPEALAYNGSYPSFYEGILGTAPDYGQGYANFNKFKDGYILGYGGAHLHMSRRSVLLADAINIAHSALTSLTESGVELDYLENLSCSRGRHWEDGEVMWGALLNSSIDGVSGKVSFDKEGMTKKITYNILNFREDTFIKIGSWKYSKQSHLQPPAMSKDVRFLGALTSAPSTLTNTLAGFHLVLGMLVESPLAYLIDDCQDTRQPSCWLGFAPELTTKLAADLNFTFEYVVPEDRKFGGFDSATGQWNGLIRDLLEGKTNYSAQALAISTERSNYIDFSMSFYEGGASFIVLGEDSLNSNHYFFLDPFDKTVWSVIIITIVLLTFLMTGFTKWSPYSKYSPETIDKMYYYNSVWVVLAGVVGQGSEPFPKSLSGRCLLFSWWFFALILGCLYTANLTANLTLKHVAAPIHNIKDLLKQNEYDWGVIGDRNIESRLLNHVDPDYLKLVEYGEKLDDLNEATQKVRAGGFILIDEASVLTYQFRDDCSAVQVNEGIMNSEWAFGFPRNSPFKELVDNTILVYRENGYLSSLWKKWYNKAGKCGSKRAMGKDIHFGMNVLSGLFYVFGMLVFAASLLFAAEVAFVYGMKRLT